MEVKIVVFGKGGARKTISLAKAVTTIGRRSNCDLWLPFAVVSRQHCRLIQAGNQLKLRDLGSRNGTYLNGQRVSEAVIKAGDCLQVGPVSLVFQIDGQPVEIKAPFKGHKKTRNRSSVEDLFSDDIDATDELMT